MWISWECVNMNIKRGLLRGRMRWAGRVSLKEERRVAHRILVGKLMEGGYLGDQGVDEMIMLNLI
jgi:hypothetical protein